MTCGSCGSPNPAGRKFCGECGERLALACATCGASLDEAQKFCGECGTPTAGTSVGPATRTPPAQPAPVAERRLVSVLFADLVGFTPFSEERDSEEVRETLTRYFDIASQVIGNHGGTVEKFIGDAVMAVWGTPIAREDDAERAVRAALELLDAIKGLGLGISARAGVLTGEAAVTLGATNQGMVAGDIVNTAARIQSVATPGTVLVGEATFRAASAAIAFEEAGEHQLKGKEAPFATWRALRVIAERGGRGRQELLEPPFTGRDDELRLLKELFHATAREGRARLISVTGPAGIGKSRLAWEFEKYLDGVVDQVWWNHGRSPSYGAGVTFWALGEMIRARCDLPEHADEATTRAKVAAMLDRHLPDPAERTWVEPAILALLGQQAAPVAADELFARWRLLFERLTATGTVVLVFEDLHWADPATLDFIDHLLEWSRSFPILVVTLARPELIDERPEWGAGRRNFVSVALDPLPEAAMRALLAGLVPDLPEDAVHRIVERAEGIPLYAVETIRMLLAEKRLALQDGRYVPVGDISTLAVPETLTALIAARLDSLDPADRGLVLDAAVLGQRFAVEALAAIAGLARETLEPRLRTLVRRELLSLEVDPRSPERGQYGFVQALIREVAYNTLSRRDRKERHLAAARYFETVGSDELAGALAVHYLAAHENAPEGPEADALATQARLALRGAAERAVALASNEQAVLLLRQALTVATGPADRADLLERLGLAADTAGRYAEAYAAFEEAATLLRGLDDRRALVRVIGETGTELVNAKRMDEALALLEASSVEFADLGEDEAVLAMHGVLARCYFLADRFTDSIRAADTILETAEHGEHVAILADVLVTKGSALVNIGRMVEGLALLTAGRRLAEEHALTATMFRAINNGAVLTVEVDPAQSYRVALEGLDLARRMGATAWVNNYVGNIIFLAVRLGDWDLVEREATSRLDEHPEAGDRVLILSNLVAARLLRGRAVDDLEQDLDSMVAILPEQQIAPVILDAAGLRLLLAGRLVEAADSWEGAATLTPSFSPALVQAARAALWAGDPARARALLDRYDAMHLYAPAQRATIRALRAGIAALEAPTGGETEAFTTEHALLLAMGLRLDAVMTALDAGMVLGPGADVRPLLDDARSFIDERDAVALRARLDAIEAGEGARDPAARTTRSSEMAEGAARPA